MKTIDRLFVVTLLSCVQVACNAPGTAPNSAGEITIGTAGGTVTVPDGPTLHFPPGALAAKTVISVVAATDAAPAGALTRVFKFGPPGTTFARPVEVDFQVPSGTTADDVYWTKADGSAYQVLASTRTGTRVTTSVTHFSSGFVGSPCSEGAACTTSNACRVSAYSCGGGTPACVEGGALADGTACGQGEVCNAGACGPPLAVTVAIQPRTASLPTGGAQIFNVTVGGTSNTAVTYSVQGGSANGTVDSSGVYTAPSRAGVYTVVVTSVADPSRKDTATITVSVPGTRPGTPQQAQATGGCRQVQLSWASADNASSYVIKRSSSAQGSYVTITPSITATRVGWSATDTFPLDDGVQYFYQVIGHNVVGDGLPATASTVTLPAPPVFIDPNNSGTLVYGGDTQISLTWTPYAAPGFTGTAGYLLLRSASLGGTWTPVTSGPISATSITDVGLTPSTHYYYQLTVTSAAGAKSCPAAVDGSTGAPGSAITQGANPALRTFVSDTGATSMPADLSAGAQSGSPYAFAFPSAGTEVVYPGVGTADGRFTIPNVPAGYNHVVTFVASPLYTSTRVFDLSSVTFGRPGVTLPNSSTLATVDVTNVSPWNSGLDHLEIDSLGAGFSGVNVDQLPSATQPPPGATQVSITGDFYSQANPAASVPLIDQQAGDVPLLVDLVSQAGTPLGYLTPASSCVATLAPATMLDGKPVTLSCALVSAAPATALALDWRRSQMHATATSGVPAGLTVSPAGDSFDVLAIPDSSKYRALGLNSLEGTVVSLIDDMKATDVSESISYSNPFPSSAWSLEYSVYCNFNLTLNAPASAACPTPAPGDLPFFYRQAGPVSELASPVLPEIGAAGNVNVTHLAATSGGVPEQINWSAPVGGGKPPTRFQVTVYQLKADASTGCASRFSSVAVVWTDASQTSVIIRPEFLPTQNNGGTYVAQVRSFWMPDEPLDLSQPGMFFASTRLASSFAFSTPFTH